MHKVTPKPADKSKSVDPERGTITSFLIILQETISPTVEEAIKVAAWRPNCGLARDKQRRAQNSICKTTKGAGIKFIRKRLAKVCIGRNWLAARRRGCNFIFF
jgi:hypothetical protein